MKASHPLSILKDPVTDTSFIGSPVLSSTTKTPTFATSAETRKVAEKIHTGNMEFQRMETSLVDNICLYTHSTTCRPSVPISLSKSLYTKK